MSMYTHFSVFIFPFSRIRAEASHRVARHAARGERRPPRIQGPADGRRPGRLLVPAPPRRAANEAHRRHAGEVA